MTKFIPHDKLSKRARRERDNQRRTLWPYSPVTKKIESKKRYNRKKNAHDRYDETGMGVLLL